MNLPGQYLVMFGESKPPEVHLLSQQQVAHYASVIGIRVHHNGQEEGMRLAAADTFGEGAEFACPTWGEGGIQAMAILATGYVGPHAEEVQRICACIAGGVTFGKDEPPSSDGGGGTPAKLQPAQPRKPPGGAKASTLAQRPSNRARSNSKPALQAVGAKS